MNKAKANKIKPGSLFKKKDTGVIIRVISKGKNDGYTTARVNKNINKKGSHEIKAHDLLKHYVRLN